MRMRIRIILDWMGGPLVGGDGQGWQSGMGFATRARPFIYMEGPRLDGMWPISFFLIFLVFLVYPFYSCSCVPPPSLWPPLMPLPFCISFRRIHAIFPLSPSVEYPYLAPSLYPRISPYRISNLFSTYIWGYMKFYSQFLIPLIYGRKINMVRRLILRKDGG